MKLFTLNVCGLTEEFSFRNWNKDSHSDLDISHCDLRLRSQMNNSIQDVVKDASAIPF